MCTGIAQKGRCEGGAAVLLKYPTIIGTSCQGLVVSHPNWESVSAGGKPASLEHFWKDTLARPKWELFRGLLVSNDESQTVFAREVFVTEMSTNLPLS